MNHDGNTVTETVQAVTQNGATVNVTVRSQDVSELKTLTEVGITEIDYRNNSFTRNGQTYYIGSPNLETAAETSASGMFLEQ